MQCFSACRYSCSDSFMNFLCFFFFYNSPYARFIYLEMTGNAAADLNLWYISSNSTFSCNVMTFLCFLGALSESLEIPWCYLRLTSIALNTMKMIRELQGHLLLWYIIYWRDKLLTWRWLASHSVSGYSLECTLIATGVCVHTQSCLTLCDPMDYSPPGSSLHGIFPGKNTRVGCHFLLQGIFPTQGLNPHLLRLLHCRWILYLKATWEIQ